MQLLPMASSPDGLMSARHAVITKTRARVRGGGVSPEGPVHTLLMQFFALGSSKNRSFRNLASPHTPQKVGEIQWKVRRVTSFGDAPVVLVPEPQRPCLTPRPSPGLQMSGHCVRRRGCDWRLCSRRGVDQTWAAMTPERWAAETLKARPCVTQKPQKWVFQEQDARPMGGRAKSPCEACVLRIHCILRQCDRHPRSPAVNGCTPSEGGGIPPPLQTKVTIMRKNEIYEREPSDAPPPPKAPPRPPPSTPSLPRSLCALLQAADHPPRHHCVQWQGPRRPIFRLCGLSAEPLHICRQRSLARRNWSTRRLPRTVPSSRRRSSRVPQWRL